MCKYILQAGVGTPKGRHFVGSLKYTLLKSNFASGVLAIRLTAIANLITLLSLMSLCHLGKTWFMAMTRNTLLFLTSRIPIRQQRTGLDTAHLVILSNW